MLFELPSDNALVLWLTYRDARLWAAADEESRESIFCFEGLDRRMEILDASGLSGEAFTAVQQLALIFLGADRRVLPCDVSQRCGALAAWSAERGWGRSALLFSKVGSVAEPESAREALRVAQIAGRFGWTLISRSWLRRSIALARRSGDRVSYGEAFLTLGWQAFASDRLAEAERLFRRSWKFARRHSLQSVRARALRGCFRVAAARGHFTQARQYARAGIRAFGSQDPAAATLEYEMAALLLRLGDKDRRVGATILKHSQILDAIPTSRRIELLTSVVAGAASARHTEILSNAWFSAVAAVEQLGETREAAAYLARLVEAAGDALDARRARDTLRRADAIVQRASGAEIARDYVRTSLRSFGDE